MTGLTEYYRVEVIKKPHRSKARQVGFKVNLTDKAAADRVVAEAKKRGLFAVTMHLTMPQFTDEQDAMDMLA